MTFKRIRSTYAERTPLYAGFFGSIWKLKTEAEIQLADLHRSCRRREPWPEARPLLAPWEMF